MKNPITLKRQLILVALMLLCGLSSAWADDGGLIYEPVNITLTKAGTLSERISEGKKYRITNLVLSGDVDIHDIQFVREMAGCYDETGKRTDGHLRTLDISGAKFKSYTDDDYRYPEYRIDIYDVSDNGNVENRLACLGGERTTGTNAFAYLHDIQKIILPQNLTAIGAGTFFGCSSLPEIDIPNGVTKVGFEAFMYCTSLTEMSLPEDLTTLGSDAFYGCTGLKSISLPSGLTSIEWSTFYGCTNLASVTIPSGVTVIKDGAFSHCYSLGSVSLPSGLVEIGDDAFAGCSGIAKLKFPSGLTTIGKRAFYGCYGLTSLSLPENLTTIGSNAFGCCSGIASINAAMPNPPICSGDPFDGVDKDRCKLYVPRGSRSAYFVANYWGDFADIEETGVIDRLEVNVDIPGTLSAVIDEGRKGWIVSLKVTGTLNDNDMQYLREMAGCDYDGRLANLDLSGADIQGQLNMGSCVKLQTVVLPYGIDEISQQAFIGCGALTSVDMPSMVTSIGSEAFYKCRNLESIDLSHISRIDDCAFMGCVSLKELNLADGVIILWGAFGGCDGLTTVSLPYGASVWESFNGCRNLETVILPTELKDLSKGTFFGCPVKTVYAYAENPDYLGVYGTYAFDESMVLEDATLYVPRGCAEVYRESELWNGFGHIEEFDSTLGVGAPTATGATEVARYSAYGQFLAAPQKGLNIIRMSDGTTRKMVVKQ